MKDWETRLMDEHEELEIKIEKLSNFIDENPDNEDYDLLMEQLEYMKGTSLFFVNVFKKLKIVNFKGSSHMTTPYHFIYYFI